MQVALVILAVLSGWTAAARTRIQFSASAGEWRWDTQAPTRTVIKDFVITLMTGARSDQDLA